MKRVIKMSKAWIAALVFGIALTGCGGGSSSGSSSDQSVSNSDSSAGEESRDRSAALSWNAPLKRQNEQSLSMGELSGYVINYGQDPSNLSESIVINNASQMDYTFEELGDGTWYFNVQAEDDNGLMSPPSDTVSKTI